MKHICDVCSKCGCKYYAKGLCKVCYEKKNRQTGAYKEYQKNVGKEYQKKYQKKYSQSVAVKEHKREYQKKYSQSEVGKKHRQEYKKKYQVAHDIIRGATHRKYGKLPAGVEYHHYSEPYEVDKFMILTHNEHRNLHAGIPLNIK